MSDKWIAKTIRAMVSLGAEMVTDEEFGIRKEICKGCEHYGDVTVLPGVTMKGCLLCGCPTETKARFKRHFSYKKMKVVDTECPQKKWIS